MAEPGQDLERDLAVEPRVLGEVDDALAAAAELLQDPVVADAIESEGGCGSASRGTIGALVLVAAVPLGHHLLLAGEERLVLLERAARPGSLVLQYRLRKAFNARGLDMVRLWGRTSGSI